MLPAVLNAYGFKEESTKLERIHAGLINHTWKVTTKGETYILQKVNDVVFKHPEHIAHNIKLLANYLQQHHPGYLFIAPLATNEGNEMFYLIDEGHFRLFPFVPYSHTINVVETPEQAFEASVQFGRFTRQLNGIATSDLKVTIPFFHDLSLRYAQFQTALSNGNPHRIKQSHALIKAILENDEIVSAYNRIKSNPQFKLRVTHHDTKISNVLFDDADKGLCVIDLDTVMPGYFISDVGDMMRTYLSPVSEEEKDFDEIVIRDDFYQAIVSGYLKEMKDELSNTEKKYFFYAGKFMIYMQALRFLSDHLNDDVYYGAAYEGQNAVRANNQLILLQRLIEKENVFANVVAD